MWILQIVFFVYLIGLIFHFGFVLSINFREYSFLGNIIASCYVAFLWPIVVVKHILDRKKEF